MTHKEKMKRLEELEQRLDILRDLIKRNSDKLCNSYLNQKENDYDARLRLSQQTDRLHNEYMIVKHERDGLRELSFLGESPK
jgi:hypothetical protein